MKKWLPWAVLAVCAILLAAIIFSVVRFVKLMNGADADSRKGATPSVEEYFESSWQGFSFVAYDSQAQCVLLQKQLDVTYEQACSFGRECYEELALGHVDTMQTMRSGCSAACHMELLEIKISGISSDGEVIYTVYDDGRLTACWEQ